MNSEYPSVQFTVSAGTEPITWSASSLPKGLTLSSSGLLAGTPTKSGKFNVTIKAKNDGGQDSVRLPLVIFMKPDITTTKLSNATTDKTFSARIAAKGTAPISWDIKGLPETLTFTPNSTGANVQITGTPTEAGTYPLTITAGNLAGTDTVSLTLTVKGVAPKLTASLVKGTAGSSYTETRIKATGTKPINLTCYIQDSDKAKFGINSLAELGLTFSADAAAGTATLTGTPIYSVKNLPIYFAAENVASTNPVTKKANLTILGQKPEFLSPSEATTTLIRECEILTSKSEGRIR